MRLTLSQSITAFRATADDFQIPCANLREAGEVELKRWWRERRMSVEPGGAGLAGQVPTVT